MDWLDSRYPAWKAREDMRNHKPSPSTSDFSVEEEYRYKDPGVTGWAGYPLQLGSLELGARFEMLNYEGTFMKVHAPFKQVVNLSCQEAKKLEDSFRQEYATILNTQNHTVSWMSKIKPCRRVR